VFYENDQDFADGFIALEYDPDQAKSEQFPFLWKVVPKRTARRWKSRVFIPLWRTVRPLVDKCEHPTVDPIETKPAGEMKIHVAISPKAVR